ncbi:MAG: hypothetical protein CFE23_05540 [Flavobacterium sp. BFFFF1]|uniref:DUF3892 domain-containing protein n=1 Tax=unclassified Flavobacterium TaxID=196869 RepID=UPI000BD4F366|nr:MULTISPECIES: DUF3892 domain-containing protein [unclassified Flavobacterium]OYU81228.1 MAG: hypothetical protein CFE23_05540 [Flavobacterium sp. BFFFF1]
MRTTHQIRFVKKTNQTKCNEKISHIGGINPDGSTWEISQQEAIKGMESGKWMFYLNCNEEFSRVLVAVSPDAEKYLKTELDYLDLSLLLLLPDYPYEVKLG